jgi:hypothetical protein
MAGSRKSISRLLDRHKSVLGREMDPTNSQEPFSLNSLKIFARKDERYLLLQQGCQMVYFQTKNPNLGKFSSVLYWTMLVYFNGHLVYFVAILYIL